MKTLFVLVVLVVIGLFVAAIHPIGAGPIWCTGMASDGTEYSYMGDSVGYGLAGKIFFKVESCPPSPAPTLVPTASLDVYDISGREVSIWVINTRLISEINMQASLEGGEPLTWQEWVESRWGDDISYEGNCWTTAWFGRTMQEVVAERRLCKLN